MLSPDRGGFGDRVGAHLGRYSPTTRGPLVGRGRRAQILCGAIDTIVELGWARSSLARIAERIGASKGAILHYFPDKDALVGALEMGIHTRLAAAVTDATAVESTSIGRIREYIRSNIDFLADNPSDIAAMVELGAEYRSGDHQRLKEVMGTADPVPAVFASLDLAALLAREQRNTELGDFDPGTLAMVVRGAIDAAERRVRDGDFDSRPYGRELAETVERRVMPSPDR